MLLHCSVCSRRGSKDGQAGTEQSFLVTLEDKILYAVLGKMRKGGLSLLPRKRRRLCFPGAWLRAAL